MLERIAGVWADGLIRYFSLPSERKDIIAFGMTYLLIDVINVIGVTVAGVACGALAATVVAALTSAVFRSFTGGAHFSGPWLCCIMSSVIMAACGVLALNVARGLSPVLTGLLLLLVLVAAALTFYWRAPVAAHGKPISATQRVAYRKAMWILLAAWGAVAALLVLRGWGDLAVASGLGLAWQVWTLTPGGAAFYHLIDGLVQMVVHDQRRGGGLT